MELRSLLGFSSRWIVIIIGVAALFFARAWLRERYHQVVKAATTPDKNPIWQEGTDWSEKGMEFDPESVVQTYNFAGPDQ